VVFYFVEKMYYPDFFYYIHHFDKIICIAEQKNGFTNLLDLDLWKTILAK